MSNQVLANNATNLAISTPKEISFDAVIEKNALRSVKGITRERLMLNASKLFSTCAEEVRSMLGVQKGLLLPEEVATKLRTQVDDFVQRHISRINPSNALSFRRGYHHDSRQMRITDRITAVGENILGLKEQKLGCTIILNEKNKRLNDLYAKPTPDHDREMAVKEEIAKLERTLMHIEACIASLEKKTTETK